MLQRKVEYFILAPAFAALFLFAGFSLFGSSGHDDTHITFWASHSLLETGEILNYNGDRTEQSSSLLLTVVTAVFAKLFGSDIVYTGYLIGIISGAACLFVALATYNQLNTSLQSNIISRPTALLALLTSCSALVMWTYSGMETTLAALCLTSYVLLWGTLLTNPSPAKPWKVSLAATTTLALVSVRPEMPILTLCIALGFLIQQTFNKQTLTKTVFLFYLCTVLFSFGVMLFRLSYFGQAFPQPTYAKVSMISANSLTFGLIYLLSYGFHNIVYVLGAAFALTKTPSLIKEDKQPANPLLTLAVLAILGYSGFIAFSGGDWMFGGRFLVPVIPLSAVIFVFCLQKKISNQFILSACLALTVLLQLPWFYLNIKTLSNGTPAWTSYRLSNKHHQRYSTFEIYLQEHRRDMHAIDRLDNLITELQKDNHQNITIMSRQAGMVFYYTAKKHYGKVTFIDAHSLVDTRILNCSLSNTFARTHLGLDTHYDDFLALYPEMETTCGIKKPDIIYDIHSLKSDLNKTLTPYGYTQIHSELGNLAVNPAKIPMRQIFPNNLVFVKNELLKKYNFQIRKVNHSQLPLHHRWLSPLNND